MAKWYYSPTGTPAVYQEAEYLYDRTGKCLYFENSGWWYEVGSGQPLYYRGNDSDVWLYTVKGKPAFYSDRYD